MRHKAGIWILFLLLPCPGTTVGLSCSNNLLPLRRTPNEYWPNWLAAAAPEAGTETEASRASRGSATIWFWSQRIANICICISYLCLCPCRCLCLCLCLTLSLPKTQSIIFNLTLDREMELQIYNRYSCIYRYVFDADICRDIGIFTVAVARVKDMNAATDTFICRYSCTFRCIHTSI